MHQLILNALNILSFSHTHMHISISLNFMKCSNKIVFSLLRFSPRRNGRTFLWNLGIKSKCIKIQFPFMPQFLLWEFYMELVHLKISTLVAFQIVGLISIQLQLVSIVSMLECLFHLRFRFEYLLFMSFTLIQFSFPDWSITNFWVFHAHL